MPEPCAHCGSVAPSVGIPARPELCGECGMIHDLYERTRMSSEPTPLSDPIAYAASQLETAVADYHNRPGTGRAITLTDRASDLLEELKKQPPAPSVEDGTREVHPQTLEHGGSPFEEVPHWVPKDAVDGTLIQFNGRMIVVVAYLSPKDREGFIHASVLSGAKLFKPAPTPEESQQPAPPAFYESSFYVRGDGQVVIEREPSIPSPILKGRVVFIPEGSNVAVVTQEEQAP